MKRVILQNDIVIHSILRRAFLRHKQSQHLRWCVLLICLIIPPLSFADRGISVVPIKDSTGKQVGLYEGSHALIIGVSNYLNGWPMLPGVKENVEDICSVLELNGFNVRTILDPDKSRLEQAFEKFITDYGAAAENRLLFYFAGHGHTLKPKYGGEALGYIVPVEAPTPNIDERALRDFKRIAMSMQRIEEYALKIDSKHAIFIFDSCFSGSIFALSRGIPEHISYKTSLPVRQFITSGDAGEKVSDKSIFCEQFVSALDGEADLDGDTYVTGTELGVFLQQKVINYSKGSQHPLYGKIRNPNLDKGDFVFVLSGNIHKPQLPLATEPVFDSHVKIKLLPKAYLLPMTITLRSGEKIVGKLKHEEIRFQSNRFGIRNIKVSNIISFAEDKLSLKDDSVIFGKFIDDLTIITESGYTFSGIKWIDIEKLSMKSSEEGVNGKETLLETAKNKPPPYTPPNYTKIFKDSQKDQNSSFYGSVLSPALPGIQPQDLSNMIDSKIPLLQPGEFEKEYMHDVMPSLPKDMMKPLPPEKKDEDVPFDYNGYLSDETYSLPTSDYQADTYDTVSPNGNSELAEMGDIQVEEEIGVPITVDDEITDMTVEQLWDMDFEDIF